MDMKKHCLLLIMLSLFPLEGAHAEVQNCNGVWTNQPCNSKSALNPHKTTLSTEPPRSDDQLAKDEMRRLYHDLDMQRLQAQRQYKVRFESGDALGACIGASAELERCRAETTDLKDKLSKRIYEQQALEEQKRTNTLLLDKSKNANGSVENMANITIYESDPAFAPHSWYPNKYDRHPPHRDDRYNRDKDRNRGDRPPRPVIPKGFKPQNRFQAGDGFINSR